MASPLTKVAAVATILHLILRVPLRQQELLPQLLLLLLLLVAVVAVVSEWLAIAVEREELLDLLLHRDFDAP